MFAHVTNLRYWKSERADITTCEDASHADTRRGLFCVADGAGTTLFSNIWAAILVEQFVRDPLMGSDLFEMEWWIRQAQQHYRAQAPQAEKLELFASQKAAGQGAYATLVTLRFIDCSASSASAELLAIGDSCALIGHKGQLRAFPLQHAREFDRAPYCVPALLKNLRRKMLYPKRLEVTLEPGDTVILATDAVARWIIGGGETRQEDHAWQAFQEVASKTTEDDWRAFIDTCRFNQSIVDDDSTALIIRLQEAGEDEERLGSGDDLLPETLAQRKAEFERALEQDNKELVAILYGDGRALQGAGISLPAEEKMHAREVADALREVLQAMREAANLPNFAARLEPVWRQYADVLMNESCAENICKSLTAQGVRLKQAFQPPRAVPGNPGKQTPPPANTAAYPPMAAGKHAGAAEQIQPPELAFADNEPEAAQIFSRSVLPAAALAPNTSATLQRFRAALATHDPEIIVNAYDPSIEGELNHEERARLEQARAQFQFRLEDRLRAAIDQDNDEELLTIRKALGSPLVTFEITEPQEQRMQLALERQAALEHLQNMLDYGTSHQKVAAYRKAAAYPALASRLQALNSNDREQLGLAQRLVDALQSDTGDMICSIYNELEFSPLNKHFLFTQEDQQRIQQARAESLDAQYLRALLQSGKATIPLLLHAYQPLRSSQNVLGSAEVRIIDAAQNFARSLQEDQQPALTRSNARSALLVRHYHELFFSPYRFVFSAQETQGVARERARLGIGLPPIMQINTTTISIGQFLALYTLLPYYAGAQIALFQQRLKPDQAEAERQSFENSIASWRQRTSRITLPESVLDDLIDQALIEQLMAEEPDKTRRALAKEVQNYLDDFFKKTQPLLAQGAQNRVIELSEQQLRNALRPYALRFVFERHLQESVPGQTMSNLLSLRRQMAQISYYLYPDNEPMLTTPHRRECWLLRWWSLRDLGATATQQGGSEYA